MVCFGDLSLLAMALYSHILFLFTWFKHMCQSKQPFSLF